MVYKNLHRNCSYQSAPTRMLLSSARNENNSPSSLPRYHEPTSRFSTPIFVGNFSRPGPQPHSWHRSRGTAATRQRKRRRRRFPVRHLRAEKRRRRSRCRLDQAKKTQQRVTAMCSRSRRRGARGRLRVTVIRRRRRK